MALAVGTKIYYTGDMANASGNFEVTAIETSRWGTNVTLKELAGGEDRKFTIQAGQIGSVYQGHCNPRFVTEEARQAYRNRRD